MSLTEQTPRTDVILSTATDVIPFTYQFDAETELLVVSDGRGTLIVTIDYTVTGAGTDIGGDVTMVTGVIGEKITVLRNTPLSQTLVLRVNGRFFVTDIGESLDKLTKIVQEVDEELARCLKTSVSVDNPLLLLPDAEERSMKVITFDENGDIELNTRTDPAGLDAAVAEAEASAAAAAIDVNEVVVDYAAPLYYAPSEDGVLRLSSVSKAATASMTVRHDGVGGATGIAYSVNDGSVVYAAIAADTGLVIAPPTSGGGLFTVSIWAATSSVSGRVGDLTYLEAVAHHIFALDVTRCDELTYLACGANELASIDVSGLTALTTLTCGNNNLTSLDVSGFTALTTLACHSNNLTSLDVSSLTALTTLDCHSNNLTSLDASGLTALTTLDCYSNNLTSLDVSGLTALTSLTVTSNNLTSLDVSGFTALTTLDCSSNNLTSLDVSDTALVILQCDNNSLTSLVVLDLTALKYFVCHNNPNLAVLNISNCTSLELVTAHTCPSLVSVIAQGADGAGYYSYSSYQIDFTGSGLETDAVYSMLDEMVAADPSPSWINLTDSPCDGGTTLVDGVINTGADTTALASQKNYTLII